MIREEWRTQVIALVKLTTAEVKVWNRTSGTPAVSEAQRLAFIYRLDTRSEILMICTDVADFTFLGKINSRAGTIEAIMGILKNSKSTFIQRNISTLYGALTFPSSCWPFSWGP